MLNVRVDPITSSVHSLTDTTSIASTSLLRLRQTAFGLCGPFPGTVNDTTAYQQSHIEADLRRLLAPVNAGRPLGDMVCACGDSAFPRSEVLQCRLVKPVLSADEVEYNRALSTVRIVVEWGFARLFSNFAGIAWFQKLCWHKPCCFNGPCCISFFVTLLLAFLRKTNTAPFSTFLFPSPKNIHVEEMVYLLD